ncbi:MAG: glycosyltransferase [Phycisphaerales bacterium]|nr:MAG: glycosyltransferase [Phycisphaerales bacterium]
MDNGNKQELLILNRTQFGYHLDTYYYSKFAAKKLRITYVGFDVGRPRLALAGVEVKYVSYKGRRLRRFLRLLVAFARAVKKCCGAIFIEYFPGCSVLRCLCPHKRIIVDIRTGSVHQNPLVRRLANLMMQHEVRLFRNISVVCESLAERLRLPLAKTHILPLGAQPLATRAKCFDELHLLYVGTLDGRRIEDTVVGFDRFSREYGDNLKLSYTIVGDGHNGELERLRRMVRLKGLGNIVHLPGYVHTTRLQETFEHSNVGISYVPMNDVYDCQPVTKTFEYVFAGMPVIATATAENRKMINRLNGVLIQDTPQGFYCGLKEVYARRREFDAEEIRLSCPESSWDRIVRRDLVPYIQDICQS